MWGQAGEESIRLTERDTCSNIWGIEDAGTEAGPSNLPTAPCPSQPGKAQGALSTKMVQWEDSREPYVWSRGKGDSEAT